ncbi:anthranilate synthase component I family protein [Nesterenkonia alkaliphila]|nr:anthranilate synthase component I family protein [Nesterenkonia alkaliphila]GFZ79081.1 hypothetical protein GCM10011359_04310 [Nesterenkonia alkaliphila]
MPAAARATLPFSAAEDAAAELFGSLRQQLGQVPMAFLDSSDHARSPAPHRSRYSILAFSLGRYAHTADLAQDAFGWLAENWKYDAAAPPQVPPGTEQSQPAFQLGWVGWIGYEEQARLFRATHAVVIDHHSHTADVQWLAGDPQAEGLDWVERVRAAVEALRPAPALVSDAPGRPVPRLEQFSLRDARGAYLSKVRQAQRQIYEGNSYEVCLTTAVSGRLRGCPWEVYLRLRQHNRAPFTQFIEFPPRPASPAEAILSTSPERFASISAAGTIRSEPIKGTRPRGSTPETDAAQLADLYRHPKDRAENVMIADLVRNDLSIHAVPGSLRTERLCAVESYPTVHQLVSTISAQLPPRVSRARALADAFPPGSMTGAPKISTMEILRRLETGPRGAYSGAAGWFSSTGACDLAVLIRTAVLTEVPSPGAPVPAALPASSAPPALPGLVAESAEDRPQTQHSLGMTEGKRFGGEAPAWDFHLGLGGAITADSDPEAEWQEIVTKSRGVLGALKAVFPHQD